MKNYIVIDGGTTNTRIGLVCGQAVKKIIKIPVGAGKSAQNRELYVSSIRDGIKEITSQYEGNIECILAAGMITSDLGLYKLDHIEAPAGIKELKKGIKKVVLPDVSDIPFCFIPGVKTVGTLQETDMMRGEECEVYGIAENSPADTVYVLPGSHSKIIHINKDGRISGFCTLLSGEMIAALSGHTILRDAVNLQSGTTDKDYLLSGYRYCEQNGINESLFKVRILKNLMGSSESEIYSFFIGAVLQGEIKKILSSESKRVVLAGKKQLREATAVILHKVYDGEVIVADDSAVEKSTFMGMIKIFESK